MAAAPPTHALGRLAATTVDATTGGIGLGTIPQGTTYAEIAVETAQIRFTVDGTSPTAAVGRLANPGDTIKLSTSDFTKFKAFRTTSTSASIQADFWG